MLQAVGDKSGFARECLLGLARCAARRGAAQRRAPRAELLTDLRVVALRDDDALCSNAASIERHERAAALLRRGVDAFPKDARLLARLGDALGCARAARRALSPGRSPFRRAR